MPKVAFYTLGCRLNFAESSGLAREFSGAGYEVVEFGQEADLYVINTCTVTAAAEKKCRQVIHQAHRAAPWAKIAVVGCFSQLRPQEVAALEGVDFVLGTRDKHLLFDYVRKGKGPGAGTGSAEDVFVPSYSSMGRTRSFFKIQDGCDNFCSYCAIPYARGRSRSHTVARTMEIAREIARQGTREIVLTGVNIGDFGRQNGENLLELLQALDGLDGVDRIRIGSVEPDLLTDAILELMAGSRRLMPHLHIPLQAGSDAVLKQMRRHYDRAFFARRVGKIRELMPHAFIACDLIVGFPTETSEQFDDAYAFVSDLDLSALHVFSYSDRAEADASCIPPVYAPEEKAYRSARMHALSDRKKEAFYRRFENSPLEVLWESDTKDGQMFGYTPNYLRVMHHWEPGWENSIVKVSSGKAVKDVHKDWCLVSESE